MDQHEWTNWGMQGRLQSKHIQLLKWGEGAVQGMTHGNQLLHN